LLTYSDCGQQAHFMTSNRAEFLDGFRMVLPILIVPTAFSFIVGAASVQKGLSPLEATLMSMGVFAGGGQMLALEVWHEPRAWLLVMLAAVSINVRFALQAASVQRKINHFGFWQRWLAISTLTDPAWGMSEVRHLTRQVTFAFIMGITLPIYLIWAAAHWPVRCWANCSKIRAFMGWTTPLPLFSSRWRCRSGSAPVRCCLPLLQVRLPLLPSWPGFLRFMCSSARWLASGLPSSWPCARPGGTPVTLDPYNMILIGLVTLATFAMRAIGAVVMARLTLGPVATAAFEAMPVAVLTAVAAPAVFLQGWPEALAGCLAALVGLRAPMFAVIVTGLLSVVAFRMFLP
jgi:uncharacterized membrane protein